ncbi:DNA repair helicase [Jaminaea rosea]|uniref:DNA 5'-3' helicase n=1 Tax=Jaminaea rosea TaxID=1569628 RepID=A0A316UPE9_9BASI|nr:DNA repair helicase [Jaminaea rosea]PWN27176.1 DNA repair helicase [Jaminaea rosea]
MRFYIDDLPVIFPYPYAFPEQVAMMNDLKRTLDANGKAVIESPSGTGKTVSLLSLIVSYQMHYPAARKLIYCTRTVPEIEKVLAELSRLMEYRARYNPGEDEVKDEDGVERELPLPKGQGQHEDILALGLSSRKNLCIHPSVSRERRGNVVDARCRDMTSAWACEKGRQEPGSVELCDFHENLGKLEPGHLLPHGVWTLEDVKDYSREQGICPYFGIRRMLPFVNIVVYSFHYLLDPKVAEQVSKEMSKDAIVVFDEAHNIDNVCIESLSIDLTRPMLDSAYRSVDQLAKRVDEVKKTDAAKLQDEYSNLVEGLQQSSTEREAETFMANPVLPEDLLKEAIPGNIRRAEHFVAFLKRFVEYLKTRMRVLHVVAETPTSFLQHLKDITYIERKPLRFCAERLRMLVSTLELTRLDEFAALQKVAAFATLVATYDKGFLLILEPFETENATVPNPIFHFTCLDASLAIQPVFERFSSVIITSGTISPLDMYPKMLKFETVVQESYPMTLTRQCFLPLVITRGSDQIAISSRFEVRNDPSVVRNYGSILIEYAKCIPDGIVAFFPSYLYMESIVSAWHDMGILEEVWKYKLVFIETPDAPETSVALENYRRACDNGRGAILLSVARGKVSEGIDFDHNYGRAVVMFGVPYQYTESRILKARLEFLRDNFRIRENDFLTFDAMRHAAQCVGRVLRGKSDYGLMVFADKRFARADKRSKLPKWIAQQITDTHSNLSTDMAIVESKLFIRRMAQPFDQGAKGGVSLWSVKDIEERQRKEKEHFERLMAQDGLELGEDGALDGDVIDFNDPETLEAVERHERELEAKRGGSAAQIEELADGEDEFDGQFGDGRELEGMDVDA